RIGIGDDAAADVDVDLLWRRNHRADRDVELDVPIAGDVADRAAVGAAADGLELVDDLHGADLWRAGDAAAGESCSEKIRQRDVAPQHTFDRRGAVIDRSMLLDHARFDDAHSADLAHAA